jgi:hypothetical protein
MISPPAAARARRSCRRTSSSARRRLAAPRACLASPVRIAARAWPPRACRRRACRSHAAHMPLARHSPTGYVHPRPSPTRVPRPPASFAGPRRSPTRVARTPGRVQRSPTPRSLSMPFGWRRALACGLAVAIRHPRSDRPRCAARSLPVRTIYHSSAVRSWCARQQHMFARQLTRSVARAHAHCSVSLDGDLEVQSCCSHSMLTLSNNVLACQLHPC